MAEKKHLLRALDILTQGTAAPASASIGLEAVESVHRESRPWTMGEGIQGLGIAAKVTDGEQRPETVLKVYVEKKKPRSQVSNMVPKAVPVPGVEQPIDTDVEEIGRVEKEPNTTRVRPAVPGFGVGHPDITVGTFGCLVRKRGQATPLYILSNSHVLANEGLAKIGDPILQPGPFDGGEVGRDEIGKLSELIPFDFAEEGFPNLVDAAIAEVDAKDVTSAVRLIGVPQGSSRYVRRDMNVQKTGRTTDYTTGVIRDTDYRMRLSYAKPGGGSGLVGLRDLVLCTRYTAGGDSGSAVFNMSGKVVGLHFAGSPSSSIFNKIGNVLDLLDIEIVTDQI